MDELGSQAFSGIQMLEHELMVRDFVAVLNDGPTADLCAFLTEDVIYRVSPQRTIEGRTAVLAMISDVRSTFDEWRTSLIHIAVTRDVVLAEHALRLRLPSTEAQWVMSFSSFRIEGQRISAWHQLHA